MSLLLRGVPDDEHPDPAHRAVPQGGAGAAGAPVRVLSEVLQVEIQRQVEAEGTHENRPPAELLPGQRVRDREEGKRYSKELYEFDEQTKK